MTALYVLFGILMFGVLIIVHELGHFIAAKLCDVRVEEFAVGMGPKLFSVTKGETTYALCAIPFGGFCAMTGEDEEVDDPRAFTSKKPWKRFMILAAGAFNNFVLGLLIVLVMYANASGFIVPKIVDHIEGSPYFTQEGLHDGDRFVKIDGHRIYDYYNVSEFLSERQDGFHDIVVSRDGHRVTLKNFYMVPREFEGSSGKVYGFSLGQEKATFGVKLRETWNTCMQFSRMVWMGLRQLIHGEVSVKEVSGPVGIVDMMAETGASAKSFAEGMYEFFYFSAFITVNLAIMNLLPIPAVDGGRIFALIVTVIVEAISGKKLPTKYEGIVNTVGLILLMVLMALIMAKDIYTIIVR